MVRLWWRESWLTTCAHSCTVLGKAEGTGAEWHGHVTAITVAPEYRRLSLARKMMSFLERVSDETYKGFFVDLYVRCANVVAIEMYEGMGYSAYRRVREYYGTLGQGKGGKDEEDAYGTRTYISRNCNIELRLSRYEETYVAGYTSAFNTTERQRYHCRRARCVIDNDHEKSTYWLIYSSIL